MKKLLLTLAAVVGMLGAGSGNAWADDFGLKLTTPASDESFTILNSSSYDGIVSQSDGSAVSHTARSGGIYFASTNAVVINKAVSYKITSGSEARVSNEYIGFKINVPEGKQLDLSKLDVTLGVYGNISWQVVISNDDLDADYETSTKAVSSYNSSDAKNVTLSSTLSLKGMTGNVYVRLYYWISGSSGKYLTTSNFSVTGTFSDAPATKQVKTPDIKLSDLDATSRVYTATITCGTEGASIVYAFDNTESTTWLSYNNTPVSVEPGQTIYAKATDPTSVMTESEVASAETEDAFSEVVEKGTKEEALSGKSYLIKGSYNAGPSSNIKGFADFSTYPKIRIGNSAGNYKGFRINVNEGYKITAVKVDGFANSGTDKSDPENVVTVYSDITFNGVYVDGAETSSITETYTLPSFDQTKTSSFKIEGLNASSYIDFSCSTTNSNVNQAVVKLTIYYELSETAPEKVATITFNSEIPFATLYLDKDVAIPSEVTAYTGALSTSGEYFNLTQVTTGVIPANTGVILEGTAGASVDFYTTTRSDFEKFTSVLSGSTEAKTVSDVYVLSYNEGKEDVGFYKFSGTLPANKAYLEVAASNAPAFRFNFGDETDEPGNVTGINAVTIENRADNVIYDLRGRRVLSLDRPGLYIVNGKKVAIQ
jgi:hypothetical protein